VYGLPLIVAPPDLTAAEKDLLKDLLQKQKTLIIALRDKNNDTEKKQTQLKNEHLADFF